MSFSSEQKEACDERFSLLHSQVKNLQRGGWSLDEVTLTVELNASSDCTLEVPESLVSRIPPHRVDSGIVFDRVRFESNGDL